MMIGLQVQAPVVPHGLPTPSRQLSIGQHGWVALQVWPMPAHVAAVHTPPTHEAPVQQSAVAVQTPSKGWQARAMPHTPALHTIEQHSLFDVSVLRPRVSRA